MRRARGILGAALAGLLAIAPPPTIACPVLVPEILALGGGLVWVRYSGGVAVFSLREGTLRKTLQTELAIQNVHFDARRGEFWGTAWGELPVLWTWSESAGFKTRPSRARLIYASYQAETGQRLIAATLSTAAPYEQIAGAFVALGIWKNDSVRFVGRAPPPALFQSRERNVGGEAALFGYLIHTARGEPVAPPEVSGEACYVRVAGGDRWLMADRATLRLTSGFIETGEWQPIGEVPAPRAGSQFRLAGLFADSYRTGHVAALVDVNGIDGRRVAVSLSRDSGRSWERILEEPSVLMFPVRFAEEGVWIQTQTQTQMREENGSVVTLTFVLPSGARGRTITLRLPTTGAPGPR